LFEISDRLHVIAKGRLSPSIARARASVTLIGEWMSGLWGSGPGPSVPQGGRQQENESHV
jgi:simple sugar transport system ATP-binding protein